MTRSGSDPFVEQVREASDIVDIVGSMVELKRASSRWKGLCPFHGEKTPSFYVSPDYQTYHCFGCGEGGDVFSFVMQQENMTFPEALRHLADRGGIQMPDDKGPSRDRLERIRQALKLARGYYIEQLRSPDGAAARAYLESRDVGQPLWESYGLGLAPDAWDGLIRRAGSTISEQTLVEAGLAVEGNQGRVYDRFRNRVIIPIDSSGGTPIGFGGRNLGPEEPKYLNSPETAVYRKGTVLFGAPQARKGIRKSGRVLVVEGYFDVLALVQGGLDSVVGTCGTALTPEQAVQLKRFGGTVILLFDGDGAGVRAALRALPVLVGTVDQVRIAFPPKGIDPDDWIRRDGSEAVEAGLGRARGPIAFLEDQLLDGALNKQEAAAQAVGLVAKIGDPLVRDLWIQEVAGRFGLHEHAIEERLRSEKPPAETKRPAKTVKWSSMEATCLRVALQYPDRAGEIAEAATVCNARGGFVRILQWIQAREEESEATMTAAQLVSKASEELPAGGGLSALPVSDGAPIADPNAVLLELKRRGVRVRMEKVTQAIRRAEETQETEQLAGWLAEKQRLVAEQRQLDLAVETGGSTEGIADETVRFGTPDSVQ